MALSANIRSSIFMMLGMGVFAIGDALTKYSTQTLNLGQFMFLRGILCILLLVLIASRQGVLHRWRDTLDKVTILRGLGEIGATTCYLVALTHLSLAFVSSVYQAVPLAVTLGAVLFLGEKVGWRRWLSISIGFIGVLIIIRPGGDGDGTGMNAYALLLLVGVCFTALRDLSTRRINMQIPTALISAMTSVLVTMTGFVMMQLNTGWQQPTSTDLLHVGIAAVLLIIGYHCIILATRAGDMSFASPFRYTSLLWAIVLSYIVFNQAPDQNTLIGAAIVVASGCYMLYREAITGYRQRKELRKQKNVSA
ncbi:DMT family transporter [Pseudochrobactrum asaccharolyticum]|uniref:Drug/metabolite transporter (DMT)-like permease n=1 Tax=Pseudochrobactrum asaccharolyticum TaxID=354351 RepID=A0A366E9N8_9HYPH|nr:DMT family transporter [Pseudochrobactrum asaccharolyticum]RBO99086.1 drug/metabolite transporter (DMT)-like permease [Pseudochrobactrum asaccharolyticum]